MWAQKKSDGPVCVFALEIFEAGLCREFSFPTCALIFRFFGDLQIAGYPLTGTKNLISFRAPVFCWASAN